MRKLIFIALFLGLIGAVGVGCRSAGSREFIPGQGWRRI